LLVEGNVVRKDSVELRSKPMNVVQANPEVETVDSIILGAADDGARQKGLRLSAPAKDYLLRAARRQLDAAVAAKNLEARREEAARSTGLLIEKLASRISTSSSKAESEVTTEMIGDALKGLCEYFPDLFPFCPRD
jgi:hypothetical protein